MGFTLLALGKGKWFVTTEIAANLIHLSLVWAGLFVFGLEGVSIAFFTLYVLYVVGMLMVCHHLTGFFWSSTTLELLIFLLPVVALTFIAVRFLPIGPATLVGVVILFVTSLFCLRGLVQRIGYEHRIVQMAFKVPGLRYVCGL
jgi:O-antigen/teichoic acid export membrane protein